MPSIFFDEGTFDVPAVSAFGKNVRAFNETKILRKGYSLKDYIQEHKSDYGELNAYMEFVSKAGELESLRQDIDLGLKIGCSVAEAANPGAGKACRAAQFIANVSLIANVSSNIEKAMNKVGALKDAKYVAVKKSLERKPAYSSWQDHNGSKHDIESSDMERMLFGTPIISLQTVRNNEDSIETIVPLALYGIFEEIESYEDISKDSSVYDYSLPISEFIEINRNHLTSSNSVMIKDVRSEQKNGFKHKYTRYAALDGFLVRNFIREYRFIIDDFQPDELRLIKLDFNARMQIAYERSGNLWYVYRGTDNLWEKTPIDTLSESPVRKNGLFVFRPKDIFNKGVTDSKDSILLSAIQEDGANNVSVYMVNKVGYANNQRISFKFQAVDYLIEEGWPKSFETVSKMDMVDIYSNDLGYGASLGEYSLIVSCPGHQDTIDVFVDSLEGAGNRYRFWADLSPVWNKHPLENSTYTLKWNLGFKVKTLKDDGSTGEQEVVYNPQVIAWGDVSAPKLSFDTTFAPKVVSSKNDDILAYVVSLDSADEKSLRGLRSFIVRKETKDTVILMNKAYVGEPSYEIRGNEIPTSWNGLADLYVQAFDFANPDSTIKAKLIDVANDSAKKSWAIVMNDSATFKSGINGVSIKKTILVDNEAPQVMNPSFTIQGSENKSFPSFAKKKDETEILLNGSDTLLVSFDIDEKLLGRDSETLMGELVFTDSLNNENTKRFLSEFTISAGSKRFVFEEPDVNRLEDGVYDLTISLIDEANNKSDKKILKKIHVDRTSPQIRGVSLGDVAYESIDELKKGTAHISQIDDDARNRSELQCFAKVNVNDREGMWKGPIIETKSQSALYSNVEFDIKNVTTETNNGFWYVYFGCYDDVGNFGVNMNFMGMGARYPEITYPKKGSGAFSGKILVRGIAPNPMEHKSDNDGEFKVSWRKRNDEFWSEKGINYLVFDKGLSISERDLAVWNTEGLNLEQGDYDLKLSVRNCDTCEWISNEKSVFLDDFIFPDSANAPKLVITPPVGVHTAGSIKDVSIELKNIPDTSKWFVSASIEAPSPRDSTIYVKTLEKAFDPMLISPFKTPAVDSDTGLSIWQEEDGNTWHVRYAGNALGQKINNKTKSDSVESRRSPYLEIRFVDGEIDWGNSVNADSTNSLGFLMDSIKVQNEFVEMHIPPYNTAKIWSVESDSVHLVFKTTAPFTVDASAIDGALYRDTLSPVVYVFPENYKAHVLWDGLVNGTYPSGKLVKMNVIAYEKGNEKNIISKNAEWFLEYEKTKIEISSNNLDKYYVNFFGSKEDSSSIKMDDYGFQFKLTGHSAYVTAEILDSANNVVHTLLDNELVLATTARQWKTLGWNGVKDDGLVQTGSFSIHLLVKNDTGVVIDTLYPFVMSLGENLHEAGKDSIGKTADLKMEEAFVDEDGNFRYIGRPDYILRTDVSATILPEDERTFNYEWDVYGTQHSIVYQKTRPSLGIRRHRDEFWTTVVTLVMSESRKYQISYCGLKHCCYETGHSESRGYYYKINVERKRFRKGENNPEMFVDLDSENGTSSRVYGYKSNTKEVLNNLVAIKIFPASSFDDIVKSLGGATYFGNAATDAGKASSDDLLWNDVYKKDSYESRENQLRNWFNNWNGQTLYYEAVNDRFNILEKKETLHNTFTSTQNCNIENIKSLTLTENDKQFVCGATKAKDEIDKNVVSQFNPHAYMMNVNLKSVENEESFVVKKFNKDYCSEMDGSGTDIKVKFVLEVNSDYWEPTWGTNNLANRYVRFDPINTTLYGNEGYITKIASKENPNFYNGSNWISDASINNGPTVFEVQRLPMAVVPENPLLFNDELNADAPTETINNPAVKFYPSDFSWRFYRGNGEVTYKAVARNLAGTELASFNSNSNEAKNGQDMNIQKIDSPKNIYFDVAPMVNLEDAKKTNIVKKSQTSLNYPIKQSDCSISENGYRFYGCNKWISHIHSTIHDWDDAQWKNKFILNNGSGCFRNPLTDANVISENLTNVETPQDSVYSNEKLQHSVTSKNWNQNINAWQSVLSNPNSYSDEILGGISISEHKLNFDGNSSNKWIVDEKQSSAILGTFTLYNKGKVENEEFDFYRSKDSIFFSGNGLNNGQKSEMIPLSKVVNQSSKTSDTVFLSDWAKNKNVEVKGIFKRNLLNDSSLAIHPYFEASYDSTKQRFSVFRNSSDIYASRENEIVTLHGNVPYSISEWNISYIQNGRRFKVAEGTEEPIVATMNVNELQGNTSFFLIYRGRENLSYYKQLDVHIGERLKSNEVADVYSMYGNVSIHFDAGAWTNDVDVTVRTMDPRECYDCNLFKNMVPIGPVLEVLPSHAFPDGKEPLVTVDISMASLKDDNIDYRNLKIYKLDAEKLELIPLEIQGGLVLLDANLNKCPSEDSCAFVRIIAKTHTFSKFVVLDSLKAENVEFDTIPEMITPFSCSQMDSVWLDTLWMGTMNGWLEFPYLCNGKSNYLLQLKAEDNMSAEHRGASSSPIIWSARNSDLYVMDSIYQSSIVFYGIDGNTEQKLGPTIRLDSVGPVIDRVDINISENEDGGRNIHVDAEISESGSGIAQTTMELFLGGNLLQSVNILGNALPVHDFVLDKKDLYNCIGCKATIKVIAMDKAHNSDEVVKQTEKLFPYPSSLVLWYPFAEGSGNIGYETMTKDDSKRLHMDLSTIGNPWNGRYGVSLYKSADSASSRYRLAKLDSLHPFTFEFFYNAGYDQKDNWSILSFVGDNEWTFGLGTYNRFFIKVGTDFYYFNTKREANIPTHLSIVVDGKNVRLYKNGKYVETIKLSRSLSYGGNGRLSIGSRNGMRSAVGTISGLRFYSSALNETQIQNIYNGTLGEPGINIAAVRAVSLTDRNGLIIDQSCSAPGKSFLRQKSANNEGVMNWKVDLKADYYSLYILHRNNLSEESRVEIFVNGASVGVFKLTTTGLWKSEKVAGLNIPLNGGINEIKLRPLSNLGIVAMALVSADAQMDGNQINYNESSWTNPEPKVKAFMKYETIDDNKWVQIRFDLRNKTGETLDNARLRYYYKGEGEYVNAASFYPASPMSIVNDAGSVFYAELSLTEAISAYGTAYFNQGPLIGLHRLTTPSSYFPYWEKTDDPSYVEGAETEYVEATGIALLDSEGNLLNEFTCYDEDGPVEKAKIKVRAVAKDNNDGSTNASNLAIYVENVGNAPVDGFEMRYYFRDTTETDVDINWNAFATSSKVNAGGDLHYVSFVYDVILNPLDKSDYGNGIQFTLHHPNWTNDFNASDDPSHHNLNNYKMVEADSIIILDRLGNLLWGYAPQPRFNSNYITKESYSDLIHREGDALYVDIDEYGHYVLETVNAAGLPLITLYNGKWTVGEHSISLSNYTIDAGSYLVLRKGSEIISWKLIK